jgi:hypothetical protein
MSCKNDSSYTDQAFQTTPVSKVTKASPVASAFIQSQEFKDYWYAGEAEITSYELQQARYGEIRNGKAVLVFVTEDFLPQKQVKADRYNSTNIPVLKLNSTKKFQHRHLPVFYNAIYVLPRKQYATRFKGELLCARVVWPCLFTT